MPSVYRNALYLNVWPCVFGVHKEVPLLLTSTLNGHGSTFAGMWLSFATSSSCYIYIHRLQLQIEQAVALLVLYVATVATVQVAVVERCVTNCT